MDDLIIIKQSELVKLLDDLLETKFKSYYKSMSELNINNNSPKNETLLSVDEVQKQLKICKNKIFDLIRSNELKSIKLNRRRLFTQEAVNNFIKEKSER